MGGVPYDDVGTAAAAVWVTEEASSGDKSQSRRGGNPDSVKSVSRPQHKTRPVSPQPPREEARLERGAARGVPSGASQASDFWQGRRALHRDSAWGQCQSLPTGPQRPTGSDSGLGKGDVKNRGDYRRDRTNRLAAERDGKTDAQLSARSDLVDEQAVAEINGVSTAE